MYSDTLTVVMCRLTVALQSAVSLFAGSPPLGDREGNGLPEDSLSQQGGLGGLTDDLRAAAGALQAGVGKVADSVAGFASSLAGRVADLLPGKKKDGVEL